jgi:hypothetical protein
MLSYAERLNSLPYPLNQPLAGFQRVRRVRDRVRQELDHQIDQHREQITQGQRRLDELLDSARRHSEAQPALIHEPLEQAIDWFDDLQSRLASQLVPTIIARQSPWCGSVDKRLKGLVSFPEPDQKLHSRSLQQNLSALLQSQVAQTVARYPAMGPMTDDEYRVLPKAYSGIPQSVARLTRLPLQLRETRDRLQRQVDRMVGVRPVQDIWETTFPEDERD